MTRDELVAAGSRFSPAPGYHVASRACVIAACPLNLAGGSTASVVCGWKEENTEYLGADDLYLCNTNGYALQLRDRVDSVSVDKGKVANIATFFGKRILISGWTVLCNYWIGEGGTGSTVYGRTGLGVASNHVDWQALGFADESCRTVVQVPPDYVPIVEDGNLRMEVWHPFSRDRRELVIGMSKVFKSLRKQH